MFYGVVVKSCFFIKNYGYELYMTFAFIREIAVFAVCSWQVCGFMAGLVL